MSRRKQANPRSLKVSMENDVDEPGGGQEPSGVSSPICDIPEIDIPCPSPSFSDSNDNSSDSMGTEPGGSWHSDLPDEPRTPPTPMSCPTPNSSTDLPDADLSFTIGVTEATPYACQFCNKAYPRLSYLKKHEQTHSDQMPFQCDFCSRLFKHKRSRDRHIKLHTGDKKYRCIHCEAAFSRSDHLKIHLRTHDNGKPFQCMVCNRGYNTAAALTSHMQNHKRQQRQLIDSTAVKSPKENRNPVEPEGSPTDARPDHVGVTNGSTLEVATSNTFSSLTTSNVPQHPNRADSNPPVPSLITLYRCTQTQCGKIFHTAVELENHQVIVHNVENAVHSNKSRLRKHVEKSSIDSENNSDSSQTRVDTNSMFSSKYVCMYCTEDSFTKMDDLKQHIHAVHQSILNGDMRISPSTPKNVSPFYPPLLSPSVDTSTFLQCSLCTMRFPNISTLHLHVYNVHRYSGVQICPYCALSFESYDLLTEHCLQMHRTNLFLPEQIKPTDLSKKTKSLEREDTPSKKQKKDLAFVHPGDSATPASTSSSSTPNQYECPGTLMCNQCDAAFPEFESFRTHLKLHLQQADSLRNLMERPSSASLDATGTSLMQEILKNAALLTCPHCSQTFKDVLSLERHVYSHFLVPVSEYLCRHCNKSYMNPEELQKHLLDFHTQHIYRCTLCREMFDSKVSIQMHFAVKHSNECQMFRCAICPNDSRSLFRNDKSGKLHIRNSHDLNLLMPGVSVKPFRCSFCNVEMDNELDLQLHLTVHFHPFKCKICQRGFPVEYLLELHMTEYHANSTIKNGSGDSTNGDHSRKIDDLQLSILRSTKLHSTDTNSEMESDFKIRMCDMCDRNDFISEAELVSHRKLVHHLKPASKNGVVSLHCAYCNENCKSRSELENHMKQHSQSSGVSGKHKCNICDELCPSAALLAEHKLTHCKVLTGSSCTHCKATIVTDEQFFSHLIQHNNISSNSSSSQISLPTPCVICRQTLISNIEVRIHSQFHLRNNQSTNEYQCVLCLKSVEKPNIVPTNGGMNSHICKDCYSTHSFSVQLDNGTKLERKTPDDSKKFSCIKCHLNFSSEHEIQTHMATHVLSENSQFECHLCRSKLTSSLKLQIHLIEHTFAGFGSYTCYLCSAVFTAAQGLHSHMLEHGLAARPYDCPRCSLRFFFRAELDNHSYQHLHEQDCVLQLSSTSTEQIAKSQNFNCNECGLEFEDVTSLVSHVKVHNNNNHRNNEDFINGAERKNKATTSMCDENEYIEVEKLSSQKIQASKHVNNEN